MLILPIGFRRIAALEFSHGFQPTVIESYSPRRVSDGRIQSSLTRRKKTIATTVG
jgi:hypothetical protein